MADYTPPTFLGATVIQYTSSIGWNDEVSRLSVDLVEDDQDAFNPPDVGSPVYFNFNGWTFNGLLERWGKQYSQSGNPIYQVSVIDPRQLLDGVAVILDNYNGTVPITNVLNVYGFLESFGFGNSGRNDSGLPYLLAINAINTMTNSVIPSSYGGKIAYKGNLYALDLTNVPTLPPDFRIGGSPIMTLMELLHEICDAAGCEMFFTLEVNAQNINFIRLFTISRLNVPAIGIIDQFVTTTDGAVSKEVGLEMVNDTCAKMVFGGKKTSLYYQSYSAGEDGSVNTGYDNTLWPYWGTDLNGNIAVGNGTGFQHQFNIDTRGADVYNYPFFYPTDTGEMIAALSGLPFWISFLWMNCMNRYYIDSSGTSIDNFKEIDKVKVNPITGTLISYRLRTSSITYRHNGVLNPHYLKSLNLGVGSHLDFNIAATIMGMALNGDLVTGFDPQLFLNKFSDMQRNTNISEIAFNLISTFAQEYYGRKWMVRLPNISVSADSDTGQLSYSALPTTAGYVETSTIPTAQANGLLPYNVLSVSDPDGRINAFVRFANNGLYDFKDIPIDSMFLSADGNFRFIKVTIEQDLVFLDNTTFTSPRAVITMPGIVGLKLFEPGHMLLFFLRDLVGGGILSQSDSDEFMKKLTASPFLSLPYLSSDIPIAIAPQLAAVPIESQVDYYGPWYIATSVGRTEVEQDESLVPWNYGSTQLMNLAGTAKVSEIGVRLQSLESGVVEYPGLPVLQLGQQLLSVGPYVTDISVNISPNGVVTRYQMKSWSPRYGKMAKQQADRFFKIRKEQFAINKQVRELGKKLRHD